jgi:PAS domain S-box-containing protein
VDDPGALIAEGLGDSEKRFRAYFEQSLIGAAVTSPSKGFVEVNQAFLDLLGYSRGELAAASWPELTHPDDLAADLELFERITAGESDGYRLEKRFLRKDGRPVDVDLSVRAVRDREGDVAYLVALCLDITARKRVEQELRESEARYRSVVENAPLGLFQSTPAGQLMYVNQVYARMFGYDSPEELIAAVGRSSVAELLYHDPSRFRIFAELIGAGGDGWQAFENVYRRKDGSTFDAVVFAGEYPEPDDGESYYFGFVQDVSEHTLATERLRSSGELIDLAHDAIIVRDAADHVTFWSRGAQQTYGWAPEQAAGRVVHELLHTGLPEPLATIEEGLLAAGEWDGELDCVTADGRHIVVESRWSVRRDAAGGVTAILQIDRDVTEQKSAAAALVTSTARLKEALDGTVAALGATVAMRDPYTAGHERRVAQLALHIAESMGLAPAELEALGTAAVVHDVGKIAVPAEILSKPAKLSEVEFAIVMAHPRAGYDILAPIAFEGGVADIVLQHHERLDGSGYPQGLTGKKILPEARILAVADVVEAMASYRPYRPALGVEAALAEVRWGADVRYDEAVVDACERVFAEGFAFAD